MSRYKDTNNLKWYYLNRLKPVLWLLSITPLGWSWYPRYHSQANKASWFHHGNQRTSCETSCFVCLHQHIHNNDVNTIRFFSKRWCDDISHSYGWNLCVRHILQYHFCLFVVSLLAVLFFRLPLSFDFTSDLLSLLRLFWFNSRFV